MANIVVMLAAHSDSPSERQSVPGVSATERLDGVLREHDTASFPSRTTAPDAAARMQRLRELQQQVSFSMIWECAPLSLPHRLIPLHACTVLLPNMCARTIALFTKGRVSRSFKQMILQQREREAKVRAQLPSSRAFLSPQSTRGPSHDALSEDGATRGGLASTRTSDVSACMRVPTAPRDAQTARTRTSFSRPILLLPARSPTASSVAPRVGARLIAHRPPTTHRRALAAPTAPMQVCLGHPPATECSLVLVERESRSPTCTGPCRCPRRACTVPWGTTRAGT